MSNIKMKPHDPSEYMSGREYGQPLFAIMIMFAIMALLAFRCNAQSGPTFWVYDGSVALPYPFNPAPDADVTEVESNQFLVDLTSFSSRWFTMEADSPTPPGTNTVDDVNYPFWGVTIWGIPSPQTSQYGIPDGGAGAWIASSSTNHPEDGCYHKWDWWTNHVQVDYGDYIKFVFPNSVTNIGTNWPVLRAMETWTTNSGASFGTNYQTVYMLAGWNYAEFHIKPGPVGQVWHQALVVTNYDFGDTNLIFDCTNCFGNQTVTNWFPPLKLFNTNQPPDLFTNPPVIASGTNDPFAYWERQQAIKAAVDWGNSLQYDINVWNGGGIPNSTYQIHGAVKYSPDGQNTGDLWWETVFTGTYDTNGRGYASFSVTNSPGSNATYFFRTTNRYFEP